MKCELTNTIIFFQCSDKGVDDHFGIGYLPRLVYFEGDYIDIKMAKHLGILIALYDSHTSLYLQDGIPEMFDGAEVNEAEVLAWISKELATNEVLSDFDLINCQLIATDEVLSDFFDLINC